MADPDPELARLASSVAFVVPFAVAFVVGCMLANFLHEVGHYCVGRWLGLRVLEVRVGKGPLLLRWNAGGTQWVIRLFPLWGKTLVAFSEGSPATFRGLLLPLVGKTFVAFSEGSRPATFRRLLLFYLGGPMTNLALVAYFGLLAYVMGGIQSIPIHGEFFETLWGWDVRTLGSLCGVFALANCFSVLLFLIYLAPGTDGETILLLFAARKGGEKAALRLRSFLRPLSAVLVVLAVLLLGLWNVLFD